MFSNHEISGATVPQPNQPPRLQENTPEFWRPGVLAAKRLFQGGMDLRVNNKERALAVLTSPTRPSARRSEEFPPTQTMDRTVRSARVGSHGGAGQWVPLAGAEKCRSNRDAMDPRAARAPAGLSAQRAGQSSACADPIDFHDRKRRAAPDG